MTLQLPAPVVRRLVRSPLSLVVCQVRIEENLRLAEPRLALRLREGLSESYPKISRLAGPRTQLIQQASGIQVEQLEVDRRRGHRLSSAANDWHITLEPDAFALETTGYTTWTEFLPRFQELVTFVSQEAEPELEARVGLRYVNIVRGTRLAGRKFERPAEFAEFVAPWLCGPLTVPDLAQASQDVDGRSVLELGSGCILNARYGTVRAPDEELSFLLDFDAYREAGKPFDVESVSSLLEELNRTVTSLFEASFSETGLAALMEGGERVDDSV